MLLAIWTILSTLIGLAVTMLLVLAYKVGLVLAPVKTWRLYSTLVDRGGKAGC